MSQVLEESVNVYSHEEFIESLVREQFRKKREALKIPKELEINYKKLKKFRTLELIEQEIETIKMRNLYYKNYCPISDFDWSFDEMENEHTIYSTISMGYNEYYHRGKEKHTMDWEVHEGKPLYTEGMNYCFRAILKEYARIVQSDMSEIISSNTDLEVINGKLNKYMRKHTSFNGLTLSYIPKSELDERYDEYSSFMKEHYARRFSKWTGDLIEVNNSNEGQRRSFNYPLWYSYDRLNLYTHSYKWSNRNIAFHNRDLVSLIALNKMARVCFNYFNRDEYTKGYIMDDFKKYMNINSEERLAKVLNEKSYIEDIESNDFFINPDMIVFFVVCMSNIIEEELEIQQIEEALNKSKSNYATSYITKKNIPNKILDFMENNEFLNMFSYVEADELCDLDKLRVIEQEFVELSNKIPMPKMETYSLRFRRLGRQHSLGLYYPLYRTMCVDIRSVSSFMREYFHMLDYRLDMLSLDSKFKPLKEKYKDLLDEYMKQHNICHQQIVVWSREKKYGSKDYMLNENIFARLGEIYIREVLQIKTSFNKREFTGNIDEALYLYDDELLEMIKNYFDDIFKDIKDNMETI